MFPTWTPKIDGQDSISELQHIKINGTELAVMIRGHHKDNPVIIVVHGGPGCSEIPYIRKYQEELEKNFTIVHYDQRGINETKDNVTGILFNSEYNLLDAIRYALGVYRFQDILMERQSKASITQLVESVDIPIWFIMGQYDHMTSTTAAQEYFNALTAPKKSFIIYEHSAHYPQLEEKERFIDWMIETFAE